MDDKLWKAIQAFNLDEPDGEYNFTVRLAHENTWTKHFTQKAITEYKKFMYLAATAGSMVSPSEITDIVWHQHLLFTESYSRFCNLLGKHIQHIPSTHSREEPEKFRLARERTKMLYEESFGKQPPDIWEWDTIDGPLQLTKSKYSIGGLIVSLIFFAVILLILLRKLLLPVYLHIDNPYFLTGYITIFISALFLLKIYNRKYLEQLVYNWPEYSYIRHLHPMELVYLKYGTLSYVIHGYMDQLVRNDTVVVNRNMRVRLTSDVAGTSEEQAILSSFREHWHKEYRYVLDEQVGKPIFRNIADPIYQFKDQMLNSTAFIRMFAMNLATLMLLLVLGCERWLIGNDRQKPVMFLGVVILGLAYFTMQHLRKISKDLFEEIIPEMNRSQPGEPTATTWEWQYLLLGIPALTTAFIPLASRAEDRFYNSGGSSSCGSSGCGSGDGGSGCGGGCGGCGGGD